MNVLAQGFRKRALRTQRDISYATEFSENLQLWPMFVTHCNTQLAFANRLEIQRTQLIDYDTCMQIDMSHDMSASRRYIA